MMGHRPPSFGVEKRSQQAHSSPARQRRNRWRSARMKLQRKVRRVIALTTCSAPEVQQSAGASKQAQPQDHSAAGDFRDVLASFMRCSELVTACFVSKWTAPHAKAPGRRFRDLFPVPPLREWPLDVLLDGLGAQVCLDVANWCLGALNCLELGLKSDFRHGEMNTFPSAPQASAQKHVCCRVVRFLARLNGECGATLSWEGSFSACEQAGMAQYEDIRSTAVDLPAKAGTCCPARIISPQLRALISDASEIFPGRTCATPFVAAKVPGSKRLEYVRLTARELRCGKLRLRKHVHGQGSVSAARKSKGRQRKIWDGSYLSERASRPPKPRRLANPSSFLDLEVAPGETLLFSKRDAATCFDTLTVPVELRSWFGQPPVRVKDLVAAGLSFDEIHGMCDDVPVGDVKSSLQLFPVHCTWPMGFSWSSAVAQDTTVATCMQAGISEHNIISLDCDPPSCHDEVCFVATDDTILVHKHAAHGNRTLESLDAAFACNGIPRNHEKDISLQPHVTALGCDLSNHPALVEPNSAKMAETVRRAIDLLVSRQASPRALNAHIGIWQWFALMQRGLFSIFDAVYAFVQKQPTSQVNRLTESCLNEVLTLLLLAPLLPASLDRQPCPKLIASDAAPEFGFGVCACDCSLEEAAGVCRMAERRGDYVRLTADANSAEEEIPRRGRQRRLNLHRKDFKTIISAKAKWKAHSGVPETHAYLLALKWTTRQTVLHHRKIPFLVDAKAVLGAVTKGRSSARALRTSLRGAAAHVLAANILPRLVYVPSESNPADAPSRGKSLPRTSRLR
ncbi:unnamed protein product [Symbiodinium sp. CCMP2592]|nr:unnamed protein product [Symbiodinium sp. CCMP2592]